MYYICLPYSLPKPKKKAPRLNLARPGLNHPSSQSPLPPHSNIIGRAIALDACFIRSTVGGAPSLHLSEKEEPLPVCNHPLLSHHANQLGDVAPQPLVAAQVFALGACTVQPESVGIGGFGGGEIQSESAGSSGMQAAQSRVNRRRNLE